MAGITYKEATEPDPKHHRRDSRLTPQGSALTPMSTVHDYDIDDIDLLGGYLCSRHHTYPPIR